MNNLKLKKIVFCAVVLSYAFLLESVSIANPVYEVESSGKNETSAVNNLKTTALRKHLQSLISPDDLKKNSKFIRSEFLLKAELYTHIDSSPNIQCDNKCIVRGSVIVDENSVMSKIKENGEIKLFVTENASEEKQSEASSEDKLTLTESTSDKSSGVDTSNNYSNNTSKDSSSENELAKDKVLTSDNIGDKSNNVTKIPGSESELFSAIRAHNIEKIRDLIKNTDQINQPNEKGDSPLTFSLRYSPDLSVLKELLSLGANPDFINTKTDRFPLLYAVIMKNKERELFIDALLKGGANPNLKTEKSKTALITLIDNGDDSIGIKDAIKILIDAGADPNLGDSDGLPPLFYAADLFNVEAVKALIDNGADVKSFLSIESDGTSIAELLFDKQPDDDLDDEDKKARQEVVELLKPYR